MIRSAFTCLLLFSSSVLAGEPSSSGLIAGGTRWETAFHVIEGQQPGPTVVITGGVHGDEPAGAVAAEQIRHWPILKGRLVVIPRMNGTALAAGKRLIPGAVPNDGDLNRNFPKTGGADVARGDPATALWSFISIQHPAWLIDLHEGYGFHRLEPGSVGSSIIDGGGPIADAAIPGILTVINATIPEEKRRFVNLSPPADGSLARAAAERLGAATMILETTRRDQPLSRRTRQHRIMVRELLMNLGMVAPETSGAMMTPVLPNLPRVAIYDDEGVGSGGPEDIETTLAEIPGSLAWRIGAEDIREGALRGFDLVVFPGGSGGKQGKGLGTAGRDEIRRFVKDGGGYAGICAGAYLAASNYPWSLGLGNYGTFSEMREIPGKGPESMWYRGPSAMVTMETTDPGKGILGDHAGIIPVRYHNGPVILVTPGDGFANLQVLARFRSEVFHYETQKGTMTGTPAIISATYGTGRVLAVSPHPEATDGLRPMLAKGLKWAAGK